MSKVHIACLLGGVRACPPSKNFWNSDLLDCFWCTLRVKLQKLDNLLLNLVVFEAHRIKGATPFQDTWKVLGECLFVTEQQGIAAKNRNS